MDVATPDSPPARPGLAETVVLPHERALAALHDRATSSLAAVSWLSAHLAAVEQTLYAEARRLLPDGRARVQRQLRVDRRLHDALWRLDRRLTGDVHLVREPVAALERGVRDWLDEHSRAEQALVRELEPLLDAAARDALAEQVDGALEHAPTRPHPHTPHPPLVGAPLARIEAFADRLRDAMDNRDVPTPHPVRPPLRAGRWGAYLLGRPYADPDDARRSGGSQPSDAEVSAAGTYSSDTQPR